MLIRLLVRKVHFELSLSHDQQQVIAIKIPLHYVFVKQNLLVGFLAHIVHVPDEDGVVGLLDFECDEFLVLTVPDFLDCLDDFDRPRLLQFGTAVVKGYSGLVVEDEHVGHGQAANGLPVEIVLLVLNEAEGRAFGFEEGEGVLIEEHDLKLVDCEEAHF